MKHEVIYSPLAVSDLDRIWDEVYEMSMNLNIVSEYISDLMDKVETKTDYPKSGIPLYYEDMFTGYYYVAFKAYLIFYRIENNNIIVDRILNGRSDYIRILELKQKDT